MTPGEVAEALALDDRLTMYGRCGCGTIRDIRLARLGDPGKGLELGSRPEVWCPGCGEAVL